MTRVTLISFALTMLAGVSGCDRKPTTVPEAPAAKADLAPPEEYEMAGGGGGGGGGGEEEIAPGLKD